jgi:hypothetical protein
MPRGYEPENLIQEHGFSKEAEPGALRPSAPDEHRDSLPEERHPGAVTETNAPDERSPEHRKVYEVRGRVYRVRNSEIQTMAEVGKFRALAQEDLQEFVYRGHKNRLRADIGNLIHQGLVQMKSIAHEEEGSRQLLALTKNGLCLLQESQITLRDQTLYHGFTRRREAHHDADLYRLYQKAAETIGRMGGRNLRVVLDYEFKKRVYQDLAKIRPACTSAESKRSVAEQHGLKVVREKIIFPDVRIEYDTPEGEQARVDIELATGHYRLPALVEKVRAGFSIYARPSDASKLRRVLDEHELTAQILSL